MFKKLLVRFSVAVSRLMSEILYLEKRLTGKVAKPEAFEAMLEKVKNYSPLAFNEYLRANFKYKADGIDYSQHPLAFIYEKQGDCDDYAHLAARLLERMGYETYLITVFADVKRGHAVCVGTKDGKSYGFGNWPLMHFTSPDFIEAGKTICRIGYDSAPEFIVKFDNRWRWLDYHQE